MRLGKTTQEYLRNKDRLLFKWRLQKWWTLLRDYLIVQDKPPNAVSAYTQVKMEDAPKLLKIPRSECPEIWIRLPRRKWPKSRSSIKDAVVLLERNLYGHPLACLLWERYFEKRLLGREKERIGNVCFSSKTRMTLVGIRGWFLNWTGKQQIMAPTWKELIELVDLDEPTSFLDHVCVVYST